MTALGLILLLRAAGRSYALAGLVDGVFALGIAVGQPALGRMIDRLGMTRVMSPLALVFPASIVALSLAGADGAPSWLLVLLALAAGMLLPPIGAAMRGLWPRLLSAPAQRATAYALEAIFQEVQFVVGPPFVAGLAAATTPRDALFGVAGLAGGGDVAFILLARRRTARRRPASGRALDSAGARIVLLASLLLGGSFGAVEVAMPAFAELHGVRVDAGILLSTLALGSLAGGVVFGTRTTPRSAVRRMKWGLVLCGVAILPLLAAPSLALMAVLMALSGVPIAPTFAAQYLLLDALAVPGAATETFAWNTTATFVGAAVGNAAGGAVIAAASYRASLALGIAFALLSGALAFTLARRGSLTALSD
jgi:MFS family permease